MINTNMPIVRIRLEKRAGNESQWENKRNILLGKNQMMESKMGEPEICTVTSFFSIDYFKKKNSVGWRKWIHMKGKLWINYLFPISEKEMDFIWGKAWNKIPLPNQHCTPVTVDKTKCVLWYLIVYISFVEFLMLS